MWNVTTIDPKPLGAWLKVIRKNADTLQKKPWTNITQLSNTLPILSSLADNINLQWNFHVYIKLRCKY